MVGPHNVGRIKGILVAHAAGKGILCVIQIQTKLFLEQRKVSFGILGGVCRKEHTARCRLLCHLIQNQLQRDFPILDVVGVGAPRIEQDKAMYIVC